MTTTSTVSLNNVDYTAFVCPVNWCVEVEVCEQGQDGTTGWYLKAPLLSNDAARKSPGKSKVFKPRRGKYFMAGEILGYGKLVAGSVDFVIEAES